MKSIKYIIIFTTVIIMLFSVACSGNVSQNQTPASPTNKSSESDQKTDDSSEYDEDSEQNDILQEYVDKYNATKVWQDACVSQKYILYNGESIIYLFAVKGATQTTQLSLSAVEKVDEVNLGTLVQLTIYNRTESAISIILTSNDAATLTDIL